MQRQILEGNSLISLGWINSSRKSQKNPVASQDCKACGQCWGSDNDTDEACVLWHHPMLNVQTCKVKGEENNNPEESLGQKTVKPHHVYRIKAKINGPLQGTICFICGQKEHLAHPTHQNQLTAPKDSTQTCGISQRNREDR